MKAAGTFQINEYKAHYPQWHISQSMVMHSYEAMRV